MKLKSFQEFVTEAEIQVSNPGEAGNALSQLIAANKGAQEEPKEINRNIEKNNRRISIICFQTIF